MTGEIEAALVTGIVAIGEPAVAPGIVATGGIVIRKRPIRRTPRTSMILTDEIATDIEIGIMTVTKTRIAPTETAIAIGRAAPVHQAKVLSDPRLDLINTGMSGSQLTPRTVIKMRLGSRPR